MSVSYVSSKSAPWVVRLAAGSFALAWLCASWSALAAPQSVIRIWNWNIHDKKYQQKMYKLFNERHPDIKIEYSSISVGVYPQVLEAAFAAKEPPDLFYPVGTYTFDALRTKGLIKPLNELAPNEAELKAWMAQFPAAQNKFVDGISVFDGKVYTVDLSADYSVAGYTLFYNKTLFKEVGIAKAPEIQSELRQFAAKVTQAGGGKYFGITTGLRTRPIWIYNHGGTLAFAAGARGAGGIYWGNDLKDGKWHHGGPESVQTLKLWIDMRKDGSVFPGEMTMDDEQAKMTFATNKAGLIFGFWWNPGNFLAYNADCDFDVVLAPTQDDGIRRGFGGYSRGSASGYVVSNNTKNPRAVWEVIKFICSLEYQSGYVKGGFGLSYLPEASTRENFDVPQMYKFAEWNNDPALHRRGPVLSDGANKAWSLMPGIYPDYNDVMDNVYLEKEGFDSLDAMDNRYGEALDAGIKKAQEAGYKVTRSDFAFPDWDPTKDYVPKKK